MKTKKYIKQYLLIVLVGFFTISCIDNIPEAQPLPVPDVDFTYMVVDEEFRSTFYIYSNIGFVSRSRLTGEHTWDFGDGSPIVTAGRNDTVVHYFSVAGLHNVTLTVGERSQRLPILIQDIVPILTVDPIEGGMHIVLDKTTPVRLSVDLPNPRNLPAEFTWFFPARTTDIDGVEFAAGQPYTFADDNPGALVFGNIGSQQVRLQVRLGDRLLQEGRVNIPIAYHSEVPTLYFAVRNRNIMALKLPDFEIKPNGDRVTAEGIHVLPFDMGVSAGRTPINILFHEPLQQLYLLNAGTRFTFVDDSEFHNMGDGEIRVMSSDGSTVERVMHNVGHAFNNPFDGYIDGNFLYFTNRNTGIVRLPLSARNVTFPYRLDSHDIPWFVRNTQVPMLSYVLPYGAMNSGFLKVNDVWWWGKRWNATGVFRFVESDIFASTPPASGHPEPSSGRVLGNVPHTRSFAWDSQRGFMYFTVYSIDGAIDGLYRATLSQMEGITNSATLLPFRLTTAGGHSVVPIVASGRGEGTADEPLAITQLALDRATGNVYFGLRSANPEQVPTGIHRFNPTTNNIEPVLLGVEVLGVSVNNTPTRLF